MSPNTVVSARVLDRHVAGALDVFGEMVFAPAIDPEDLDAWLEKVEQMGELNRITAEVGLTVTHRRYVSYSHAHYAGNLVDGAYVLAMFGDVATELADEALARHADQHRAAEVGVSVQLVSLVWVPA